MILELLENSEPVQLFFVIVGWGEGSKTFCYSWAKKRVNEVGFVVAEFLDFLIGNDTSMWTKLSIVGHSLGAHVAGFAGKNVKYGRVGTIIGLDPALPLFNEDDEDSRLNDNDAEYVEIIHTNAKCYGMSKAIGSADFYVNGGEKQPGCWIDRCHHSRSVNYFTESLEPSKQFTAKWCENIDDEDSVVTMGGEPGNINKAVLGLFCLKTATKETFGFEETNIL